MGNPRYICIVKYANIVNYVLGGNCSFSSNAGPCESGGGLDELQFLLEVNLPILLGS